MTNKENPNSCERDPNDDEVRFSRDDYDKYLSIIIGLSDEIHEKIRKNIYSAEFYGYNNIIISKNTHKEILLRHQQHNDFIKRRNKVYGLLSKANELEKSGNINLAIAMYHEVINIGYDDVGYGKDKPYNRLIILYRKIKDVDNEIKIIEQTIKVLLEENRKLAYRAIELYPDKKEEILSAIPSCSRVMGDNGFYCFIPYDAIKYRDRLLKIKNNGNNKN